MVFGEAAGLVPVGPVWMGARRSASWRPRGLQLGDGVRERRLQARQQTDTSAPESIAELAVRTASSQVTVFRTLASDAPPYHDRRERRVLLGEHLPTPGEFVSVEVWESRRRLAAHGRGARTSSASPAMASARRSTFCAAFPPGSTLWGGSPL